MEIGAEEQRQHICLARANKITVIPHAFHHHIEVETIWKHTCIRLIHTLMKVVCELAEMLYLIGIFLQIRLKFFLLHDIMFIFRRQNYKKKAKYVRIIHKKLYLCNRNH